MEDPTWHTKILFTYGKARNHSLHWIDPIPIPARRSFSHPPPYKTSNSVWRARPRRRRRSRHRSRLRSRQVRSCDLFRGRLSPDARDWKQRRRPAMAVPLVLVGLPIGLLFLLSGLIVNTIQVISLSRLTLP
jgi:hypothetical protein